MDLSGVGVINFDNIEIKENSYQRLIQILRQVTRLNFDYYRRNFIERRIKARMIRVGCRTLDEYYNYFASNPIETTKFLDSFNINYTYFFRNYEIFKRFQNLILECLNLKSTDIISDLKPDPSKAFKPKKKAQVTPNKTLSRKSKEFRKWRSEVDSHYKPLLKLNKESPFLKQTSLYHKIRWPKFSKNPIYIWSCACASGEEPYSLAMILDNLSNQLPNFPYFKIVASDIDRVAINNAKTAIYNDLSTKEVSKYYESKYFTKKKEHFGYKHYINEKIKNLVEFIEEDITKHHEKTWKYDIIFCRYLLIYINRENRNRFLRIINSKLSPGGLLFLGKTETLFKSQQSHFKLVDSKNHIYMKTG